MPGHDVWEQGLALVHQGSGMQGLAWLHVGWMKALVGCTTAVGCTAAVGCRSWLDCTAFGCRPWRGCTVAKGCKVWCGSVLAGAGCKGWLGFMAGLHGLAGCCVVGRQCLARLNDCGEQGLVCGAGPSFRGPSLAEMSDSTKKHEVHCGSGGCWAENLKMVAKAWESPETAQ